MKSKDKTQTSSPHTSFFLQAQLHSSIPSSSTSSCPLSRAERRGNVHCGQSISAPLCCSSVGSPWLRSLHSLRKYLCSSMGSSACCSVDLLHDGCQGIQHSHSQGHSSGFSPHSRDIPQTFPLTPCRFFPFPRCCGLAEGSPHTAPAALSVWAQAPKPQRVNISR